MKYVFKSSFTLNNQFTYKHQHRLIEMFSFRVKINTVGKVFDHPVQNRIKWRSVWNSRRLQFITWSVWLKVGKRKWFRLHKLMNHNSQHVRSIISRFKQLLISAFAKFRKLLWNLPRVYLRPSLHLSTWINSFPTRRISTTYNIWVFFGNISRKFDVR